MTVKAAATLLIAKYRSKLLDIAWEIAFTAAPRESNDYDFGVRSAAGCLEVLRSDFRTSRDSSKAAIKKASRIKRTCFANQIAAFALTSVFTIIK